MKKIHLTAWTVLLSILIIAAGCVTKSRARQDEERAFVAGQEQALAQSRPKPAVVTVNGEVLNNVIPWTEGLTLAQAIVNADYTGYLRPRLIRVTRNGQTIDVKPSALLSGNDMPLEAGDVVDLIR